MNKFYPLKVNELLKLTNESVLVGFEIPDDLSTKFSFKAGQYITIKKSIDGEELRRSYSLCSAPKTDSFQIGVKQIENGRFSTYSNTELSIGDTLEVMPPTGNFVVPENLEGKGANYMAFAAGSGITPMVSQITDILSNDPKATFYLFYGNTTVQNIMFRDTLKNLKDVYMDRFIPTFFLSRESVEFDFLEGRISAEKCKEMENVVPFKDMDHFLLCGPESMVMSVSEYLKETGISKDKINFELFYTAGTEESVKKETKKATVAGQSDITIKLDGISFNYNLDYNGKSILDAAMDKGADVPFSCKGGICCTCKAKVIEGEVEMMKNMALEEDEVANGYVLSCQSHPRTAKVVLDFDV